MMGSGEIARTLNHALKSRFASAIQGSDCFNPSPSRSSAAGHGPKGDARLFPGARGQPPAASRAEEVLELGQHAAPVVETVVEHLEGAARAHIQVVLAEE